VKVTPTPGSVSGRRIDRVGDPLDGLINLFDLALVLAVGLLLAALSSAGVVGLVAGGGAGTPIPGEPSGGQNAQGKGTAVGTVYRLQDGTYVFSPSGAPKAGATAGTGSTAPTPTGVTGVTPTPNPTTPTTPGTGTLPGGGTPNGGL
jgi:hypothetical protein